MLLWKALRLTLNSTILFWVINIWIFLWILNPDWLNNKNYYFHCYWNKTWSNQIIFHYENSLFIFCHLMGRFSLSLGGEIFYSHWILPLGFMQKSESHKITCRYELVCICSYMRSGSTVFSRSRVLLWPP